MSASDFIYVIPLLGLLLLAVLMMSDEPSGQVNISIPENVTANATHGDAPLTVEFSHSGNKNQAWDFDSDGNIDFLGRNPVTTYRQPGNYTVDLTVIG